MLSQSHLCEQLFSYLPKESGGFSVHHDIVFREADGVVRLGGYEVREHDAEDDGDDVK